MQGLIHHGTGRDNSPSTNNGVNTMKRSYTTFFLLSLNYYHCHSCHSYYSVLLHLTTAELIIGVCSRGCQKALWGNVNHFLKYKWTELAEGKAAAT